MTRRCHPPNALTCGVPPVPPATSRNVHTRTRGNQLATGATGGTPTAVAKHGDRAVGNEEPMKRRRRPMLRVLHHLHPCPDCAAEFHGRDLVHEPTCPLQNAVEDVCAADRQWFIDHPDEPSYTRPITHAELAQLAHMDPGRQATHVVVHDMPWGRTRAFVHGDWIGSLMLDW
jgi:hypothetical protein